MENSLTFREAHGAMTCDWRDARGIHRNVVKIGKGGQVEAREQLTQWAKGNGWNG